MFRVIAFSASPGVLNVPRSFRFGAHQLRPLLWSLVLMVVAVKAVLDYTSIGRAIVVCLIGWIINMIVTFLILMPILMARAVTNM